MGQDGKGRGAVDLTHCPFCKGKVDEDLVRFGGPCPHCFNAIPGEEAATNPGERLVEAERTAEAMESRRRNVILGVVAAVALIGAGVGGKVYMDREAARQAEIEKILSFEFAGADMFSVTDDEWAALMPAEDEPEPVKTTQVASKVQGSRASSGTGSGSSSGSGSAYQEPDRFRTVESGVKVVPQDGGEASTGPSIGSSGISGVETSLRSRDMVVEGDEIPKMVQSFTRRKSQRIKNCYEQRLKENESLTLDFMLQFTVNTDGSTSGVALRHNGQGDAQFDQCVSREVGSWQYLKIAKTSEFAFPYRLKPGF